MMVTYVLRDELGPWEKLEQKGGSPERTSTRPSAKKQAPAKQAPAKKVPARKKAPAKRIASPEPSLSTDGGIFVSYDRADRRYAEKLADHLERSGLDVWVDWSRIAPGASWPRMIADAVESCGALVVIMSPDSWESDWVHNEIEGARRRQKPILPLLLRGEPFMTLSSVHYEDVSDGEMPKTTWVTALQVHVG